MSSCFKLNTVYRHFSKFRTNVILESKPSTQIQMRTKMPTRLVHGRMLRGSKIRAQTFWGADKSTSPPENHLLPSPPPHHLKSSCAKCPNRNLTKKEHNGKKRGLTPDKTVPKKSTDSTGLLAPQPDTLWQAQGLTLQEWPNHLPKLSSPRASLQGVGEINRRVSEITPQSI